MSSRGGNADRASFSDKYAPEDFIVPAQDTKGQSARLWARVQPDYDRQLDVIVGQRRFPFQTKGDVVRWALKEGLKRLAKMEPVGMMVNQMDAVDELIRSARFRHEFVQRFNDLSATVQMCMADNELGEARRLIITIRRKLESAETGSQVDEHWKKRYLKTLDEKFGHIIEGTKGAKLRGVTNGDNGDRRGGRHISGSDAHGRRRVRD